MQGCPSPANHAATKRRIAIVTPVFNDWQSLVQLCLALDDVAAECTAEISIFAVNDGSSDSPRELLIGAGSLARVSSVEIIHLACNLGHQRAIAVGLAEVFARKAFDSVIVMDADGEDSPTDVHNLLAAAEAHPDAIIVARRSKRSEGRVFQLSYRLYKTAFQMLTGQVIDFGNFCLIPWAQLGRIIHMPETWNHLAGAIVKSRCPIRRVETRRESRYAGSSKMNLVALVVHGLGAISVFGDTVFVRALITSLTLSALAGLGGLVVVAVRLFTGLAIPGWASTVGALALIILFQALTLSAGAAFMLLSGRTHLSIVPAFDATRFVQSRLVIHQLCSTTNLRTLAAN